MKGGKTIQGYKYSVTEWNGWHETPHNSTYKNLKWIILGIL